LQRSIASNGGKLERLWSTSLFGRSVMLLTLPSKRNLLGVRMIHVMFALVMVHVETDMLVYNSQCISDFFLEENKEFKVADLKRNDPNGIELYSIRYDAMVFEFFAKTYLSVVIGYNNFEARTQQDIVSNLVTVEDEAFILLLLVNSEDRWMNMLETKVYKTSQVSTKFTKKDSDKTGNTYKYGGWSVEGLELYNKICEEVIMDRTEFKAIEEAYKQKKNLEYEGKVDSLKMKNEEKLVVPYSGLTYDSDDDETPTISKEKSKRDDHSYSEDNKEEDGLGSDDESEDHE